MAELSWSCLVLLCVFTFIVLSILIDWLNRFVKSRNTLEGKHVVVVGGSSGIGKEVAFQFFSRGAHITIIARDESKLATTVAEADKYKRDQGQKFSYYRAEATSYEEINKALKRCEDEKGPIYILVNCAGYSYPQKLEDIPLEHLRRMMEVNYFGTAYAVRTVVPWMKERKEGKIVIVSSIGGLIGLFGYTGYGASKFAVRGFAEALQMEVLPYDISVTISFPPDTDTPSYEEENKVKPVETMRIGETAGLFQPKDVAKSIIYDTMAGNFFSTTGFDGKLSSIICCGGSPKSSVATLVLQVLLSGPLRVVWMSYLFYFNKIVSKCARQNENIKKVD